MMLKKSQYLLLCFLMSVSQMVFAIDQSKLEAFIKQKLPHAHIGIIIQNADTGEILFEKNVQQAFLPASTAKLFTTMAALNVLGPQFQLVLKTLKEMGVAFNDAQFKVLFEKEPNGLKVIGRNSSAPLETLIKKILQDSNNIYSDSVFKTYIPHISNVYF